MGIKFVCMGCRKKQGCNPTNEVGGYKSCLSCKFRWEDECPADEGNFEIKDHRLCEECIGNIKPGILEERSRWPW